MKRRSLTFCLFFTAFLIQPASAFMSAKNLPGYVEGLCNKTGLSQGFEGFRNLKWGDDPSVLGNDIKQDQNNAYKKNKEDLNFGGFYLQSIKYGFEEGKLQNISLFYSGEVNHRYMVNMLEDVYGKPQKYFESNHETKWRLEKGSITVSYSSAKNEGVAVLEKEKPTSTTLVQHRLVEIAKNVYWYKCTEPSSPSNSFGVNAGVVIGKDGVLVIDTLISAKEAKHFIEEIKKVTDKPIKYVINTHYHLDHAFGNSEFAKLGAEIISHESDKENLAEKGEDTLKNAKELNLTEEDLKGTEIALPTRTFSTRMDINLGDEQITLIYIAPSHTSGSILVFIPDKKILFAGDILFTDFHPYIGEADLSGWIKCLDYIQTLDLTTIVPGHGPLSKYQDVLNMKDYLLLFNEKARELAVNSKDVDFITAELKKVLPVRSEGEWMIPFNVREKYLSK